MPNLCSNYLSISGPAEDRKRFHEGITDKGICHSYWPMPEILGDTRSPALTSAEPSERWIQMLADGEITQEKFDEYVAEQKTQYERGQQAFAETGYHDWYSWAHNNWGTKWGDYDFYVAFEADQPNYDENQSSEYRFTTAWGPCDIAIRNISTMFPTLVFDLTYNEEGMCFAGGDRYQNGDHLAHVYYEGDDFPSMDEDSDGEYNYEKFSDELSDLMSRIDDELNEGVFS